MGKEDEIRVIAYTIWQQEGCCDGHDVEQWLRAEAVWQQRQLPVSVAAGAKATAKPAAKAGSEKKSRHNHKPATKK